MALLGFLTRELCLPRLFVAGRVPPRMRGGIVLCRSLAWRPGRLAEAPVKSRGPVTGPRLIAFTCLCMYSYSARGEGTLGD